MGGVLIPVMFRKRGGEAAKRREDGLLYVAHKIT